MELYHVRGRITTPISVTNVSGICAGDTVEARASRFKHLFLSRIKNTPRPEKPPGAGRHAPILLRQLRERRTAAACSASFLLWPVPLPMTSPLSCTQHSKTFA